MLSGDLAKFLSDVLADYRDFNVEQLISEAADLIANKNANNGEYYSTHSNLLRQRVQELGEQNRSQFRSFETLNKFREGSYASLLPATIANMILGSIPLDRSFTSSSGELQALLSELRKAIQDFRCYIRVSNALGQSYQPVGNGALKIELKVPTSSYDNDLGDLGRKVAKYDRFLSAITDLYINEGEKPKISTVSTGSFIVDLVADASVIAAIMDAYSKLLVCASQILDVRKTFKTLTDAGLPAPELDQAAIAERLINQAFEKHFKIFSDDSVIDDTKNVRARVKTAAIFMLEEVQEGARIALNLTSEQDIDNLLVNNSEAEPDMANKILHQIRLLEQKLDSSLDPVPSASLLTGPEG